MGGARISADHMSVRQVAEYTRQGYTLRLTSSGFVLLKLVLV